MGERASKTNLKSDGARLWSSLMEMAKIGALPNGGCCRLALTDVARAGRDLFVDWLQAAGCEVTIDRFGNIFGLRLGKRPDLPIVLTGSHLDTQPKGGKFDGVYGVLAGLEAIRALNDAGIETERTVAVVSWTNEEGARIMRSCTGSGGFSGGIPEDEVLAAPANDGPTAGEELRRIGYMGEAGPRFLDVGDYIEAHIEQGPILEHEQKTIGVVTDIQGIRWMRYTLSGTDRHAGTTPMDLRSDTLAAAGEIIFRLNELANARRPDARITVGRVEPVPNSINTVAGRTTFTIDLRHPSAPTLDKFEDEIEAIVAAAAKRQGGRVAREKLFTLPPVACDKRLDGVIRDAATRLGYPNRDMLSGAFHDACFLATVAPTAMIFIPCKDGISHAEEEYASPEDCAAGVEVLVQTLVEVAGVVKG